MSADQGRDTIAGSEDDPAGGSQVEAFPEHQHQAKDGKRVQHDAGGPRRVEVARTEYARGDSRQDPDVEDDCAAGQDHGLRPAQPRKRQRDGSHTDVDELSRQFDV